MGENVNIGDLILRGGVIGNVDADTPFEVYEQIKTKIKLPKSVTPAQLLEGLSAREKVLSTAVGRGIARHSFDRKRRAANYSCLFKRTN